MSTTGPISIIDRTSEAHPAVRAWRQIGRERPLPSAVEVWRERLAIPPSSIYRLVFQERAIPAVFAKHSDPRFGGVERLCYETILPRLNIRSPAYFGSFKEPDETWWLFVEDAGRDWYSLKDPEHRVLAGRWIGRLHREGARLGEASLLPSAGPDRYLAHLRAARERIRRNFSNRGLTESDRDVLRAVLALQDEVESCWDRIERACAGPSATLVHGDFQPKNIRIRGQGSGAQVQVMDWEMAGWGNPAVDLAPSRGIDLTIQVDLEAYAAEVGSAWPDVDAAAIRRLSVLGLLLRRLAAMDWASESLRFEDRDDLICPVTTLGSVHRSLSCGLAAAREWIQ